MKKFVVTFALAMCVVVLNTAQVSAQHVWCCSYGNVDYYIDTEKIYDMRPNYFVNVPMINARTGAFVGEYRWHFSRDEGSIWFEVGQESGRISDSAIATAIYNKMRENLHLAKRSAPQTESKGSKSPGYYVGDFPDGSKAYIIEYTVTLNTEMLIKKWFSLVVMKQGKGLIAYEFNPL